MISKLLVNTNSDPTSHLLILLLTEGDGHVGRLWLVPFVYEQLRRASGIALYGIKCHWYARHETIQCVISNLLALHPIQHPIYQSCFWQKEMVVLVACSAVSLLLWFC